jgi:hypothetical protein
MLVRLSIEKILNYRGKDTLNPLYYISSLIRLINMEDSKDGFQVDYDKFIKFVKTHTDHRAISMFGISMQAFSDVVYANAVRSHIKYRKGLYKNYIPSNPLIEILDKVKIDVPGGQLPKDIHAYFELNGHHGFHYALVDTFYRENKPPQIRITMCDDVNTGYFTYIGVPIIEDENLVDTMAKFAFTNQELIDGEVVMVEKPMDEKTKKAISLVLNLVLYISGPNEDFRTQFNEFNKNNKIAQKEKMEYTQRAFTEIGFDAEFLRLIKVKEGSVSGHFRWQPCGEGRLLKKLTWIRPHTRKYGGENVL